jgi:hypothetical protein
MEPRTTTAEYDSATGHYTLYAGSGRGVAKLRLDLAQVLGVPAAQVRGKRADDRRGRCCSIDKQVRTQQRLLADAGLRVIANAVRENAD